MSNVILSVVIPTYNRYQYLKGCLSSLTKLKSEKFEIVVQDNTECNDEMKMYISELNDARIKYFHIAEHICVSDNSDEAVKNSSGKYVCMIGDDDTICENMIDAAEFCLENDIDAVRFSIPGFNWPDMTFEGTSAEANLFYREEADGLVTLIDTKKILNKAIRTASGMGWMPRVYHGIVSRECLDRIYKKTGSFFPGPSPDMGNAAAVCLEAKRAVYINDYLMVSGYGYKSAKGEGNRNAHYGVLTEKPWLPKNIMERWDKEIPPIFSAETIIADSLTESLERMGRNDLKKRYNYAHLYAVFYWHHKDSWKQMKLFLKEKPIRIIRFFRGVIIRTIMSVLSRIFTKTKKNYRDYNEVKTLEEAQTKTCELRKELNIRDLHWGTSGSQIEI